MKLRKVFLASIVASSMMGNSASAGVVGITGGHWSKHLSSDVTNEEHSWVNLRWNQFVVGRFDNSYKQEGFSGETFYAGVIRDFKIWKENQSRVVLKGSIGIMHGYTKFAGHERGADPKTFPYLAGGLFYQRAIGNDGFELEAGLMMLGDAVIPSAGALYRF